MSSKIALLNIVLMKKIFLLFILAFGMSYWGWGQTSVQNFGTSTGSQTSQTGSTSFLPNPTSGTTWARAGATAPNAPIILATASNPLGTTGAYVRAVASVSTSVSKFSPMVSYTSSTEYYTSFKILFGDASAGNTAASGNWSFYQGAGAMYSDANDFTSAQVFTGLRFTFVSPVVTLQNRVGSSWGTTGLTTTSFNQATVYTIEIVGNNKSSGPISYTYNGVSQTVAVQKFDLYINGTLIGDDLVEASLPSNTAIASNTFIGISSVSNVANVFVDDVVVYNSVPSSIGTVPTLTIANNGAQPVPGNIYQGSSKNILHTFMITEGNTAAATLTQVTVPLAGSYQSADISASGIKLYANTSNDPSTASLISSQSSSSAGLGETVTFGSLTYSIPQGTTRYFWVTADISATATVSRTINANALAPANFTFASGTPGGSVSAGGVQTIVAPSSPNISITSGMTDFGSVAVNTHSSVQSYTVSGSALTADISIVPPSGFEISTSNSPFSPSNPVVLIQSSGVVAPTIIYVRFSPLAVQSYSANITHTSPGSNNPNLNVSGTGTSPANPSTFTATPYSSSQINLAATANSNGNNIVVVYNLTGSFSSPSDGVAPGNVGDAFAGGTIQYEGAASSLTNQTGLYPNTKYYYKAFSYDVSFYYSVGATANATTDKNAPTVQAYNISFSSVNNTSMTVGWTNGNGDKRIVIINTVNSFTDPVDGTSPSASTVYVGSGEQVIYNNSGSSDTVFGLAIGTTYWFRVYEYNNSGTHTKYLLTTSFGNPASQTTNTPSFFLEDFEVGSKVGYAAGNVVCTMGSWNMTQALIGNTLPDKKNGSQSVRMKYTNSSTYGILTMNFDKSNGAGSVTVYHAIYGSDGSATWKMQISTDGGTTWSDIGSIITSTTTLTPQAFTVNQTGNVRFKIIQLSGNRINIDDIGITDYLGPATSTWTGGTSTDWTVGSNWDNGVPVSFTDVTIGPGTYQPVLTTNVLIHALTINSGAVLTINPLSSLTATGSTTLNDLECLVLKSSVSGVASFLDNGTIGGTGTARFELYLGTDVWHYISSPISNATANIFLEDYLKPSDPTNGGPVPLPGWGPYITDPSAPLQVTRGYACWKPSTNPGVEMFSGSLNTGPQTFIGNRNPSDPFAGWHLVGNPYPSGINLISPFISWDQFEPTAYFWDQSGSSPNYPEGGNYDCYPSASGFGTHVPFVPAMQGFYIHISSSYTGLSTFSLANSARMPFGIGFLKDAAALTNSLMIRVNGDQNKYSDRITVQFNSAATSGYDPGYDAYKLWGLNEAPQLYTRIGDTNVTCNSLPFDKKNMVIPMGFSCGLPGMYTLIADSLGTFENAVSVSLEDLKLSITQNLRTNPVYNFTYDTLDNANRFLLHFDNPAFGISNPGNIRPVQIYSFGSSVYIRSTDGKILNGDVTIYDMIGKELYRGKLAGSAINRITPVVADGYYVVKVVLADGVYSDKIHLSN